MFGIDNITNTNGWAMAVVGASTVFVGLAVLSFVISQVHKLLEAWDNRKKDKAVAAKAPKEEAPAPREQHLPTVSELCSIYRPLVEQLQEPFLLTQLFEKTKEMDLPHPHLSLKCLQEANVLVAQGDGTFTWNQQTAN